MIDENTKQYALPFELLWGIIVSAISATLSVGCYVNFTNEWFLLLGSLSGSAFFALIKAWRDQTKKTEKV